MVLNRRNISCKIEKCFIKKSKNHSQKRGAEYSEKLLVNKNYFEDAWEIPILVLSWCYITDCGCEEFGDRVYIKHTEQAIRGECVSVLAELDIWE